VFSRWLGRARRSSDPTDQFDPADLDVAVARAVDAVEPRLRQIGGYPQRYRAAVACALAHARALAAQVPGPVVIDREHFVADRTVHALFGSIDAVRASLCASRAMREFVHEHPLAGEVYALLAMRRQERHALGFDLQGEVLRRDVPQTLVYFSDHTLAAPGSSEADCRDCLAWHLFDALVGQVRARIEARRVEKLRLENERDLVMARLRGAPAAEQPRQRQALEGLHAALAGLTAQLELGGLHTDFTAILAQPERHLHLEATRMMLDDMGVRRAAEDAVDGTEVCFADLRGSDAPGWTVILAHCRGLARPSLAEQMHEADRWLTL
jgi:hypothetical protein